MDIEGSELKVLTKSEEIFKNIEIPVFFMEWLFYQKSKLEYTSKLMEFERWIRSLTFVPFKIVLPNKLQMLGPISVDPVWSQKHLYCVLWIKLNYIPYIQKKLPHLKF